jgi:hypothetical protein
MSLCREPGWGSRQRADSARGGHGVSSLPRGFVCRAGCRRQKVVSPRVILCRDPGPRQIACFSTAFLCRERLSTNGFFAKGPTFSPRRKMRLSATAAQLGCSLSLKGPLVPGGEPGLRFRE